MALRFAPHIGLNSPEDGLFIHHAGNNERAKRFNEKLFDFLSP